MKSDLFPIRSILTLMVEIVIFLRFKLYLSPTMSSEEVIFYSKIVFVSIGERNVVCQFVISLAIIMR